ncbi:MAG: hypothetical protein JWO45_2013 [Spartobacteria bacterium]|nr:hypothetical protein [Spartobacteria bacterium]
MGLVPGEFTVSGSRFDPKLTEYDKKEPDRVDSGTFFHWLRCFNR